MAEWEDCGDGRWETKAGGICLSVWYSSIGRRWMFTYEPLAIVSDDNYRPLNAITAEVAKLEALAIVGEWAKSLAVEAAELRGRMVDETMNAEASPWDFQTMVVCETCGNKRCPHATDAKWECTGSNEPGQIPKEVEDD